jgi:hypothetical protein
MGGVKEQYTEEQARGEIRVALAEVARQAEVLNATVGKLKRMPGYKRVAAARAKGTLGHDSLAWSLVVAIEDFSEGLAEARDLRQDVIYLTAARCAARDKKGPAQHVAFELKREAKQAADKRYRERVTAAIASCRTISAQLAAMVGGISATETAQ